MAAQASQLLKQAFAETLSPNANIRKNAENQLAAAQQTAGHSLQVLQLVASLTTPADAAIRQAAAVHFKNLVKNGWDLDKVQALRDDNEAVTVPIPVFGPEERVTIKSHLVQLMCTTGDQPQIQKQLSESISLIAATDYYKEWQNLLKELVDQFQSPDMNVVLGVLKTANSIFKRFRYVERSDALYEVILYTLNGAQAHLLALFRNLGQAAFAAANDKAQVLPRLEALRLICRIFFSLNYQDLPEFFEDHMKEVMDEFARYLQPNIFPICRDDDEDREPSALDALQTAIIHMLALYADKDEDVFVAQFLPTFTKLVWENLLTAVTKEPKHDALATSSIRFLSGLVQKPMHQALFADEATLRQIVVKIVIPNLYFRESDEERFEDDPREYLQTEVENGGDTETSRRKCSVVLLRDMCRQFEGPTTTICLEHATQMIASAQWREKDAAIHLMMGIAIRRESRLGVSEVNPAVNVLEFFQQQILPELQDSNHTNRAVVKGTCIKFVGTFRNQLPREVIVQYVMPALIGQLQSPVIVVHTFAAYATERILICKVDNTSQPKIGSNELQPFLEPLFTNLFAIVDNQSWNENDYVMKCVMRSLATARQQVVGVTQIVITKLVAALARVAKNPRNPQFNHFLFEAIAVLVKSVASQDASATTQLETLLFEPFTTILQMDVTEFTPYVFQILAQLLEYRPATVPLGDGYGGLLGPILTPDLWMVKSNVPALTRLLQAFIQKGDPAVVAQLLPILGVFQQLVTARSTEMHAFRILSSCTLHMPRGNMEPNWGQVFKILLTKLQQQRHPKYVGCVTEFFGLFCGTIGPEAFCTIINGMQNGMVNMLLGQVWIHHLGSKTSLTFLETKVHVVGLTRLLLTPAMMQDANVWTKCVEAVMHVLTIGQPVAPTGNQLEESIEELDGHYDATFSQLVYASKAPTDSFPDVPSPSVYFLQALQQVSSQVLPMIQGAGLSEKARAQLTALMQTHNINLA